MGANRKLQTEIDRTLKRVGEGIEVFDQIWDKVHDADNVAQKEKFEAELKKEIKKLQRYRDQIKTWISGTDIKDKAELVEARKRVERQMERFKVCEKETKTKAFSKEGLGQATKVDPREKARNEAREWINTTVDCLNVEIEAHDAEIERLQNGKKKAKPPPRLAHLEESALRHKAHVARLEQIMRLLDNEALNPEEIEEVREMVDDYLDRHEDAFDEFDNPDDIYSDLVEQLDGLEAQLPVTAVTHIKGKDPKEKERDKEKERERERERAAANAVKQQLAAQPGLHVILEDESPDKQDKAPRKPDQAKSGKDPPTPTGRGPATAVLPVRTDAGGAADARGLGAFPGSPVSALSEEDALQQRMGSGASAQAVAAELPKRQQAQARAVPLQPYSGAAAPPKQAPLAAPLAAPPQKQLFSAAAAGAPGQGNAGYGLGRAAEDAQAGKDAQRPPPAAEGEPKGADSAPTGLQAAEAAPARADSGFGGLPLPSVRPQEQLHLLQNCANRSLPQATDSTWPTLPVRLRGLPGGPPASYSYPAAKLAILDNPALFEKLDCESLFFAFYYQPGSLQQYLAARELKRQSWRFHKQHCAWFQRHEEPKSANDEYEQGTYVYFDYNIVHDDQHSGWCYRLKQDFLFKYDALENEF